MTTAKQTILRREEDEARSKIRYHEDMMKQAMRQAAYHRGALETWGRRLHEMTHREDWLVEGGR